jgi:hypothetical protein
MLFGKITYDNNTDKITVEHPNVKERLTWLMAPEQEHLFPSYYPDKFYQAMIVGGLMGGTTEYQVIGKENMSDDAVM